MKKLTQTQVVILKEIDQLVKKLKRYPSYREVAIKIGYSVLSVGPYVTLHKKINKIKKVKKTK